MGPPPGCVRCGVPTSGRHAVCAGQMAYREVSVIEIKEVLRLWLAGQSLREVTRLAGLDRKTVRRYVQAAQAAGAGPRGRRRAADR